jgi:hypothetical protein
LILRVLLVSVPSRQGMSPLAWPTRIAYSHHESLSVVIVLHSFSVRAGSFRIATFHSAFLLLSIRNEPHRMDALPRASGVTSTTRHRYLLLTVTLPDSESFPNCRGEFFWYSFLDGPYFIKLVANYVPSSWIDSTHAQGSHLCHWAKTLAGRSYAQLSSVHRRVAFHFKAVHCRCRALYSRHWG